jgi:hypothetical protein
VTSAARRIVGPAEGLELEPQPATASAIAALANADLGTHCLTVSGS